MKINYDIKKLQLLLSDLNNVIKTPVTIFDKNFDYLTSNMGESMTSFCRTVRGKHGLHLNCSGCDKLAYQTCCQKGTSVSYKCHAGIYETITPVRVDDIIVGYIIFGQYRQDDDTTYIKQFAEKNGIDVDKLLADYQNLTVLNEKQIASIKNILRACFLSFYLSDAVYLNKTDISNRLKEYIKANITLDITVKSLCDKFLLNTKQLYNIFNENFACTVKQYIFNLRIDIAKDLLVNTKYSVTDVAEKSGFKDYNHFIQRFKFATGETPYQYRKKRNI